MNEINLPFWKRKKLVEMNADEWEALCDHCALCCLYKLEDEESGEIFYTNVICRLLDTEKCQCTAYSERTIWMPTCLSLNPENINQLKWMPKTCAYRLIDEGKELPWWHYLVSGDPNSVHESGISIRWKTLAESEVDMAHLEDYIADWLE